MRSTLLCGLAAIIILAALLAGWQRFRFPHGHREAYLRVVQQALINYALNHDARFPDGKGPSEALAKLYPEYSNPGYELAGLSGDINQVTNALQKSLSISNLTSWVYVPGLRMDDYGSLAILWESKPGISASGRRAASASRAVLLLNLNVTNVPSSDWEQFVLDQERLRAAVFAQRKGTNN